MDTPQLKWMQAFERHVTRSHKLHFLSKGGYTRYCTACGEPVNGGESYMFKLPILKMPSGYDYQPHGYLHATWKDCKDNNHDH